MPVRLEFDDISHFYGTLKAVDGLSFAVAEGEVVCLLGPSGCGKSTSLRLAAGVERPTSGRIILNGLEVTGPKIFVPPEQRRVGLIFQDFALFPHLSIIDNVLFGLEGEDPKQAYTRAMELIDLVGLAGYESHYPHMISGGEQQRVALARALAPRPQLLLMDEPFSGLDRRLRDRVRAETMALLRQLGTSAIIVTHDPEEAMLLGDKIALMRHGQLVQIGAPRDLYYQPKDAETVMFFNEANRLSGVTNGAGIKTGLGYLPVRHSTQEGVPVDVLIRPHGFIKSVNGEGYLTGTVTESRFLGDHFIIQCQIRDDYPAFRVRLDAYEAVDLGETVSFTLDNDQVFVFPKSI